jgi:hypothetical protein
VEKRRPRKWNKEGQDYGKIRLRCEGKKAKTAET